MVHCFLRLSKYFCPLMLLAIVAILPAYARPQEVAPPAAAGPQARLWGKLTPGPLRVGFKTVFAFDPSRTWKTTRSYQKPFSPDPAGRPVRIEVWYPAQPGAQAKPMIFGDYVHISAPDAFSDIERILEARDTELAGFSVAHGKLEALLATTVYAWRDAAPMSGPFPLILYFPGLNDTTTAPSVPAEFLASHGYVVAEVALLGASPQDPNQHRTQFGIETSLRDMEFAWGLLRHEPYINSTKVGVIGHSLGSIEAMLLAMRNSMVSAVVGLDGTYGFGGDATKSLTGYFTHSPQRMFAALLDMRRPAQGFTLDLSALDSFHYSDRTFITVEKMHHSDFASFAGIAQEFDLGNSPGYVDPFQWTRATGFEGFQNVCRMVRDFFDDKLKEAREAPQQLQADLQQAQGGTFRHIDALEPPPSAEDLATLARHDGFEAATAVIERYRAVAPVQWIVDARTFNSYGYDRMAAKQFADAITAFRLNTFAYPNSANLFDSLGDGYAAAGDKANAIASYQRALELVNNDPEFDAEGKKQFANDERTKIQQLGEGAH